MPKIIQINSVANWGSTGKIVEGIGERALLHQWDSSIVYGVKANSSSSILFRIGSQWDYRLHVLQTRISDRHGLGSIRSTKKLIAFLDTEKPDIIHLHNIHNYYLNYPLLFDYLSTLETPIVWTLHDCWPITGHCSHFFDVNCNKWKMQCFDCPIKGTYPASWFVDASKTNYIKKKLCFTSLKNLTLVPVSDWLGSIYQQSFLSNYPISRIYSGIDTDVFQPKKNDVVKKYGIRTDLFIILGVSNIWTKPKGLNDFIQLSKKLSEGYQIILVGLSKKQKSSLPTNVIGIEHTEGQEELASIYSVADVYFNASTQETFGLTTIEAMACGTPAIVHNSTACPEAISKDTGFVVEPHDLDEIIKCINQVKEIGKKSFSEACRTRVLELFEKKKQFEKYIQLYKELTRK